MAGIEDELLRITEKGGKLRKKLPDNVDVRAFRALVWGLLRVSPGNASMLYFAAKKIGVEVLSKELSGNDPDAVLKSIAGLFKNMGLGLLEVAESSPARIVVRLQDSATASGSKQIGKTVCFFEAGLIAGIMEGRLKKTVIVNEVLCGALGDAYEEFVVKIG